MFSLDPEMVAQALGSARLATWEWNHLRVNFAGLQVKLKSMPDLQKRSPPRHAWA